MHYDVTSKFEINIVDKTGQDAVDMRDCGTFITRNKCSALVVRPEYVATAVAGRSTIGAIRIPYPIVAKIDDAKSFGIDKLKTLPRDVLSADGFDIMFSANRTLKEMINEVKTIKEFIGTLNSVAEIRFMVDPSRHSEKHMLVCAEVVKNNPIAMLRIGSTLRSDYSEDLIEEIREIARPKIKLSGNVDLAKVERNQAVHRFDVTLSQAKAIIGELDAKDRELVEKKQDAETN